MEKQKCPQVRFNSFYDEWKKQKLFDVTLYKNGKSHESEIVEKGQYVVVNSKLLWINIAEIIYVDFSCCSQAKWAFRKTCINTLSLAFVVF